MPRQRKPIPPSHPVERDFLLAIDRLELLQPTHPELKKRARQGKLKLNKSTVALEAGHSRTMVYASSAVTARIAEANAPLRARETVHAQDVIHRLREDNARLRQEKHAALSQLAAMALRMQQLVKEHAAQLRAVQRNATRQPRHPHQVIGVAKDSSEVLPRRTEDS
jgi:hypothetical protein